MSRPFVFYLLFTALREKGNDFFSFHVEYMCFISSHPVHHRRSCTSCPSSPPPTNCTSSPSTSALKASPGMNAAGPRPCDRAHAVSGTGSAPPTIFSIACLARPSGSDIGAIPFQPWTISLLLRPRDYYDESRLQGAVSEGRRRLCVFDRYVWPRSSSDDQPSLPPTGHSSDGGKDPGGHPQQLPRERPPFSRWRAWLCSSPDNWTGPWLPGEEPPRTHHLQLLLRAHWQAGETRSGGLFIPHLRFRHFQAEFWTEF